MQLRQQRAAPPQVATGPGGRRTIQQVQAGKAAQQQQGVDIDRQIASIEADIAANPFLAPSQRPVTAQEARLGAEPGLIDQLTQEQLRRAGIGETPEFSTRQALQELQPVEIEQIAPITIGDVERSPIFGAIKAASEAQTQVARQRALADLPAGGAQLATLANIGVQAAREQAGALAAIAETERSVRENRALVSAGLESQRRGTRAGLIETAATRDQAARERASQVAFAQLGEAVSARERERAQALQIASGGGLGPTSIGGQAGGVLAQIGQAQAQRAQAEAQASAAQKSGLGQAVGTIGGATVGTILAPGLGTAAGASAGGRVGGKAGGKSDRRAKRNIRPLECEALKAIQAMSVCEFSYHEDAVETNRIGLIAQDLYEILPEAVMVGHEGKYWRIDYNQLVAVLIAAVQDLSVQVQAYKRVRGRPKKKSNKPSLEVVEHG